MTQRNADTSERVVEAAGRPLARIRPGSGPVVALALHSGHEVRDSLLGHLGLPDDERMREEDPFTNEMAPAGISLLEVARSRFEVDLNRPRFRAVYQGPQDAWGLAVWRSGLPDAEDRVSRAIYDEFYATAYDWLARVAYEHERFVVLDLHSYNHRREGAHGPSAPNSRNPEVNLGTGKLDRERWAPVVEAFSAAMGEQGFDCRENVKFRGGHFSEWVTETFPQQGCALAIEFKKTFMDEWSGECDRAHVARIQAALGQAVGAIEGALQDVERIAGPQTQGVRKTVFREGL